MQMTKSQRFKGNIPRHRHHQPGVMASSVQEENLRVNTSKTVATPFTRKRKGLGLFCKLTINDECVVIFIIMS